MLVKCPKCNHENQLGSIFCRNCGDKLDIETMEPKVKDKSGPGAFKLIRNIVVAIVLLLVVVFACAVFVPIGHPPYTDLPEDQMGEVDELFQKMTSKVESGTRRAKEYAFTPQQLTYIFNSKFLEEMGDAGSSYGIEKVCFEVDDSNNYVIILKTKLAGKIPVRFELKGRPTVNPDEEDSVVDFNITGAKMGHLPAFAALEGVVVDKFTPLVDANVKAYLSALDSIDLDEDGNIVFTLKKRKK